MPSKIMNNPQFFSSGIKHKKTVRKLSNSSDPEVQRKLKESAELAAKAEERKAKENGSGMNPDLPDPVPSVAAASTDTTPQPNLPPGYVFIPAATAESGKDTYLCSACQHYSSDLFSLNAVSKQMQAFQCFKFENELLKT